MEERFHMAQRSIDGRFAERLASSFVFVVLHCLFERRWLFQIELLEALEFGALFKPQNRSQRQVNGKPCLSQLRTVTTETLNAFEASSIVKLREAFILLGFARPLI